jgi:CubicO group peptidase (beta-lactamase class C family)
VSDVTGGDRVGVASAIDAALVVIDGWEVPSAGVSVVDARGVLASRGAVGEPSRIASVSKLLTAYAVAVAVSEGAVELDDPVEPPGATLRHLLAHTAGYGFDSEAAVLAAPGARRIYSNRGIEEAAAHVTAGSGVPFPQYLQEAVLDPLGLATTTVDGSPAFGFHSTVTDLARFGRELLAPTVLHPTSLAAVVEVAFPGLVGVVPGVGRFDPCDWGLGFERNFGRPGPVPGPQLSRQTFGHFGGAGSFLWVDPTRGIACACLTGREFGPWAMAAWPTLCAAIATAVDL